jgi:hypothetical protein
MVAILSSIFHLRRINEVSDIYYMVLYNYMVQSVCVLGRQPVLGLAELESLYGADAVEPVAQQVAGVHLATGSVDFARLGGSTKLAEVLAVVPSSDWSHAEKELTKLGRSDRR